MLNILNFDCPHCGQNLEAEEDMGGMQIECPNCTHMLVVPEPPSDEGV